jgi:hypothetical protein
LAWRVPGDQRRRHPFGIRVHEADATSPGTDFTGLLTSPCAEMIAVPMAPVRSPEASVLTAVAVRIRFADALDVRADRTYVRSVSRVRCGEASAPARTSHEDLAATWQPATWQPGPDKTSGARQ